jgi:plasmid stabilization system protein ParE
MFNVRLTAIAETELTETYDWYENERPGLGERFRSEVRIQITRIAEHPLQFPQVAPHMHRARVKHFPYTIIFKLHSDTAYVVACFHSSRDPMIWQKRL